MYDLMVLAPQTMSNAHLLQPEIVKFFNLLDKEMKKGENLFCVHFPSSIFSLFKLRHLFVKLWIVNRFASVINAIVTVLFVTGYGLYTHIRTGNLAQLLGICVRS